MKKYILAFGLLSMLIASPLSVSAMSEYPVSTSNFASYSIEKLEALIAQLQRQLEELKKNTVACSLGNVDLSLGDGEDGTSKEHVKNFQNFLKEKGYIVAGQSATGYFGKITRTAVMNLQKDLGVSQTGELTSDLRAKVAGLKCRKEYTVMKKEYKEEIKKEYKPEVMKTPVSYIKLYGDGKIVKWMTEGYSKGGFKIVWSKNVNPTYPNRDGDKYVYLAEPGATNTALEAFNGTGTYYVRVCEYVEGICRTYSNEIQVNL